MRVLHLLRLLKQAWEDGRDGLTLQRRLFALMVIFLIAVMSAVFFILFSTEVFSSGARESRVYLESELGHISGMVEKEYGILAVEGVALAEKLSAQLEKNLPAGGFTSLTGNGDYLSAILAAAADPLLVALEKNKVSGVFMVLDTTINPDLPNSDYSRAGMFFKNMEPNAINHQTPTIRFLRGPSTIARTLGYDILPQWTMEFAVQEDDFFFTSMRTANESNLPLSRLYYWNPVCMLAGDYENAMLLCVPLIGAEGTVMGVCGFEVSSMLFKLQTSPDNSTHTRVFAMLAPVSDHTLTACEAMFTGSYAAIASGMSKTMTFTVSRDGFTEYVDEAGQKYSGLHRAVRLYPKNAVHEEREWALAVMLPEKDLAAFILEKNENMLILMALLLVLSLGAAFLISRFYIAPVIKAIDRVKAGSGDLEKTHILEIDDLISFLAQRDAPEDARAAEKDTDTTSLYESFVQKIATLSPAERAVFDLYMEGYNAKRITEILCLSINTIKTHNRRIYKKLGVSSRKELLVYVGMMKEKGGVSVESRP